MSELNDNNQNTNSNNSDSYYNPYPNYNSQTDYNNGQYYNPQPNYNNGQYYNPYPYPNPQASYQQAPPMQQPVSNVFYYILMALTTAFSILTIVTTVSLIRTVVDESLFAALRDGQSYASLYGHLMDSFLNSPTFTVYSMLNYALRMAILAVSIIDIVLVRKKGYPILGMVLFTILFKPGYFIWRAYVTKQQKLIPVLFTVFYVLLHVGYFFWCVSYLMTLV